MKKLWANFRKLFVVFILLVAYAVFDADIAIVGITIATVYGASARNIMKELDLLPRWIGAGVLGGIVLLGGTSGISTANLFSKHVFYSDTKADVAARYATYGGSAVGTISVVTAMSIFGKGTGGVGIVTALADIGSIVGGGMGAGSVIAITAPMTAVVVCGGIVYYLVI